MLKGLSIRTCKNLEPDGRLEPETPFTPATRAISQNYAPDVMGAMCDAVFLAFQLPEAPEDLEKDLDEVSCAWMRLVRSSQCLLQAPRSPPKLPAKLWTPEGRPPTSGDLKILEDFYKFITKHDQALEDIWQTLAVRTGSVTLFALRNGLGFFGSSEDKAIDKTGHVWPTDLASPEKLWAVICSLLRVQSTDDVSKEKFSMIKKFIDAEHFVNNTLAEVEIDVALLSECSGARLKSLVALVRTRPEAFGTGVDLLKCVTILLELEPKASTQILLLDSGGGKLSPILDVVHRQGLACIENKCVLSLWSLCETLVDQANFLGCRRLKTLSPVNDDIRTKFGDSLKAMSLSSSRLPLSSERPSTPGADRKKMISRLPLRRAQTISDFHPSSSSVQAKQASRPSSPTQLPPISPKSSGSARSSGSGGDKEKVALPAMSKFDVYLSADVDLANSRPSTPSGKGKSPSGSSGDSKESKDKGEKPPGKVVKRKASTINLKARTLSEVNEKPAPLKNFNNVRRKSLPENKTDVVSARGKSSDLSTRALSPDKRVERSSSVSRASTSGKAMVRRRSIGSSREMAAMCAKAAEGQSVEITDAEWELHCCQLLWAFMPPQTITFAIGACLHSVGSRKLRSKLLRSAWLLLDKVHAVECSIGTIGTIRLRMEMDMLVDQLIRSLHFGKDADPDELAQFLDKVRLTMVHLESICEADPRLAQVAVLYGVAFIAECVSTWADHTAGGTKLATATRNLLRVLSPYLQQLFQRSLESDDDLS